MIIFTDLHLREESAATVLGEVLPGILQAALAHNDLDVVFLGDWWHVRNRIPVVLLNAVDAELARWGAAGVRLRVLPGNHDQVDVAGRNALEVFDRLPHVSVYTVPTRDADGLWVPYRKSVDELTRLVTYGQSEALKAGDQPAVLFGHFGVTGALKGVNIYDDDGVPLEALQGWPMVLLGHYHRRQQLGNVQYIGSPWETRADEMGDPKGYARLVDGQLTFYDTAWGPKHYVMHISKGQPVDGTGLRPQDIVHVHAEHDVNVEAVGHALRSMGVHNHTIAREVAPTVERLEVPQQEGAAPTFRAYAEAFIRAHPCEVPEELLLSTLAEIVE